MAAARQQAAADLWRAKARAEAVDILNFAVISLRAQGFAPVVRPVPGGLTLSVDLSEPVPARGPLSPRGAS